MDGGFLAWLRTPVGRGFALIAVATASTGFAMAAQQNIVSNYLALYKRW